MSEQKPPREWKLSAHHCDPENLRFIMPCDYAGGVHVIEKSAYTAVVAERDRLRVVVEYLVNELKKSSMSIDEDTYRKLLDQNRALYQAAEKLASALGPFAVLPYQIEAVAEYRAQFPKSAFDK